jgi:tetratricopeptide (TPR) repeat protein
MKSNAAEIAQIVSKALFLKGACEFRSQNADDGKETFRRLREAYGDRDGAMLSYFEEADHHRRNGNLEAACAVIRECAEADCPYSPFAYYRCAEYYGAMGLDHHRSAIECLSTLLAKYGNHEIAYAARLAIADLLRLDGRFGDAQLVYEELLHDFPFDRRYHSTELCLAKTIFAQKNRGNSFVERALVILERLYSIAPMDRSLHVEIAAVHCLALKESSATEELKKVAWETLLSACQELESSGGNDVHWLLQIAALLENCLESDGDVATDGAEIKSLQAIVEKLRSLDGKN